MIGATNRPDAVDSALRRPGRFDREFYFPLPNREARKKIIGINTRKWTPQLDDERLDQLAGLTKGYGGADLRVSAGSVNGWDALYRLSVYRFGFAVGTSCCRKLMVRPSVRRRH